MPNSLFNCDRNESEVLKNFQSIFIPSRQPKKEVSKVQIGKHVYNSDVIIEEIDTAVRIAQSEWFHLQGMVLYDTILPLSEMTYSRNVINDTFRTVLESLQSCYCTSQKERYTSCAMREIDNFLNCSIPLRKLEEKVLIQVHTAVHDRKSPIFHYFHSFLDVHYHLLVLNYICGASKEKLEGIISTVIQDLIVTTKTSYRRQSIGNRLAFTCSCVRRFWLILQLFTETVSDDKNWFWKIFNKVLENEDALFTLWLLAEISKLQSLEDGTESERISPNYDLLESKLKVLLLTAGCDSLVECFRTIEPLLCNLWLSKARIEVFQIIWDHYSKVLNISSKKYPEKALELNDIVKAILLSPADCNEDFEIFVGMLVAHLRVYPTQWGKMKGRIYSQLGPSKLKSLNQIGIIRISLLFLSLASINFEELSKKIVSFMENLSSDKRNTLHGWNLYAVLMIRHVSENRDLKTVTPLMLRMLHEAVNDSSWFYLVKDFIENFKSIISSSTSYQLHQWLLIDDWLTQYLKSCYYSDLKSTLGVLLLTLEKVDKADFWPLWEGRFRDCIYPSLKQTMSGSSPMSDTTGKIAGKLCRLMPNLTNDALNSVSGDWVPPSVSCQFLNEILTDFPNSFILTQPQISIVMQLWIKTSLLSTSSNEDLTVNVMKLDEFPLMLRSHLLASRDPICAFIEYLGSDIKQHLQSNTILKLCDICFGHIDKWLGPYLAQPEQEAVVFHIYTCLSLAFYHCGQLLYDRNKPTSPLTKLVQVLLLPTDFLIEKKVPHLFVLNAVKKTWHLFFEAIVKINCDNDTFLERTLRDMILKYMQYFPTADTPVLKCLENSLTAPVILDKVSNFYLKHPVKESDANTLKVLKILSDFVLSTTSVPLMKLIVNKCIYGLFEIVIFHAQRNVALNVIKVLVSSQLYPHVREDFSNAVICITEKHLAFNTVNYFQLMYILAKLVPSDIKKILVNIKQHISNVEKMRGVGFDRNLRTHYEKLESVVKDAK
ncbi:hypothetical protein NQ315_004271 [Exocentrus adspersus]|uniref:MMS22-like C-terminal domain-containing protein n=1 Tax=Exocentrus adspersus TaxID=1586481 RepID=A0AAV8W6P7_9CUCU|nr:hypothetical protein NQ315_004271 [Exocentrus adspersus]